MMNYKKAFTLSCKSFRSNPLRALLRSRIARFSQTKFRFAHSYGFTLAETLIVLTILGVIAAITVPSVVKRHMEAIDRTKLKKAMTIYDYSIQKMTVENDLKSDTALKNWSEEKENCGNTTVYFKKSSGDGCEFKTADNVYWDIKDIMNPVVALSKDAMDKYKSTGETDGNKSFKFVTSYDPNTGAFRSNDLAYETSFEIVYQDKEKIKNLEDVYNLINQKSIKCGLMCQYKNGINNRRCVISGDENGCTAIVPENDKYNVIVYGSREQKLEGQFIVTKSGCDNNGNNCSKSAYMDVQTSYGDTNEFYKALESGNTKQGDYINQVVYYNCDGNLKNCKNAKITTVAIVSDNNYEQISKDCDLVLKECSINNVDDISSNGLMLESTNITNW